MPDLIALALPGGPEFVAALRAIWDAGHAALPLDGRLAPAAIERLLDLMRPAAVVTSAGERFARAGGVPVAPGDALVMATSGSTGIPKGVVLTHDAVGASAMAGSERLGADPARDRWLACLPLAHMGGLGVITRSLHTGVPVTVHPGFDAGAVGAAARAGATLTTLVPTAFSRLPAPDVAAFRAIILGGADVPPRLPPNAVTSYGLTETCGGCVYDGQPFDGVDVRLDGDGQILIRGPVLLRAYRDGTDPRDAEGWLPTGDAGHFDDDGRLQIAGRLSDLIISGGENVWPAPIEDVIRTHPAVADVAVVGRPDPEWGERIVAVIELHPGDRPPPLDQIRGLVKEQLAAFAAPRELEIVDTLPRTASGKVHRAAVR